MSSWWYLVDAHDSGEEFNPLLPHIAGVIENVEEATFRHIKEQLQKDLEKKVSDTEVIKALENGITLGVFKIKREFKVCREFTTKEIKKSKPVINQCLLPNLNGMQCKNYQDKNLMEFVKSQREKRRNKQRKGRRGRTSYVYNSARGNVQLYKYLCQKCKKSVEREILNKEYSGTSSEEENDKGTSRSEASMTSSMNSDNTRSVVKFSDKREKPPERSRLLVERNPMETDPPYYDIFT